MASTDRAFRAFAQEHPDAVVALLRVVAPSLLPPEAAVAPEEIDPSLLVAPPALDADFIARVGDDLALHIECQGYRDRTFGDRLARYHMAAALRYPQRRVHTVALWVTRPAVRQRLDEVERYGVRVRVTSIVLAEVPAERLLGEPRAACFAAGADRRDWTDHDLCLRIARAMRAEGAGYREQLLAYALAATARRYDAMVNAMKEAEYEPIIIEDLVRFGEDRGFERGVREGVERGRQDGLRRAVAAVLAARGLPLDDDARGRLDAESSVDRLERLLQKAALAVRTEDLFDDPADG